MIEVIKFVSTMRINSKFYISLCLLLLSLSPIKIVGSAQTNEDQVHEQEVIDHLIRAETWYWMARVTFNTLEYHENAEKEYLTAKEKHPHFPNR